MCDTKRNYFTAALQPTNAIFFTFADNSTLTVGQNIQFEKNLPQRYWTIKIIRDWFLSGNIIDEHIIDKYDSEKLNIFKSDNAAIVTNTYYFFQRTQLYAIGLGPN